MANPVVSDSCDKILDYYVSLFSHYKENNFKQTALSYIPIEVINSKVDDKVKRILIKGCCHPFLLEIIYLQELVNWFKNDFFHWMNVPSCLHCNVKMSCVGKLSSKRQELFCTFVELYKCFKCGQSDFINRYVDPRILMITREGRCSEYSLCFTLICLALGMRARYVVDLTDHCWTEVYSPYRHVWIHVDPSEGIVNQPLLYELGWNKKLSYIFSIGETDIQDVTWRYTTSHPCVIERRKIANSSHHVNKLCCTRKKLLKDLPEEKVAKELCLVIEELANLLLENIPTGTYSARTSGVT